MHCETQDVKVSEEYLLALLDILPDYLGGLSAQCPQPYLLTTRCNAVELCDPSFFVTLSEYALVPKHIAYQTDSL